MDEYIEWTREIYKRPVKVFHSKINVLPNGDTGGMEY